MQIYEGAIHQSGASPTSSCLHTDTQLHKQWCLTGQRCVTWTRLLFHLKALVVLPVLLSAFSVSLVLFFFLSHTLCLSYKSRKINKSICTTLLGLRPLSHVILLPRRFGWFSNWRKSRSGWFLAPMEKPVVLCKCLNLRRNRDQHCSPE